LADERNRGTQWPQHHRCGRKQGVSRQALSTVLNGHANLSADMALRFERQFKISADTLMRMQTS
jgi:addiction module HigA family antidote